MAFRGVGRARARTRSQWSGARGRNRTGFSIRHRGNDFLLLAVQNGLFRGPGFPVLRWVDWGTQAIY
jgi:hypothetical protein